MTFNINDTSGEWASLRRALAPRYLRLTPALLAAYPLEAPGETQDGQVRLSAKIDQACDDEPLRSATPVSALVLCCTWSPDFAQFLFRALYPELLDDRNRNPTPPSTPGPLPLVDSQIKVGIAQAVDGPGPNQALARLSGSGRRSHRCSVMCLPSIQVSLRLHRHRAPVHLWGAPSKVRLRVRHGR
eukprot:CAMPEP_0181169202 /NCGR_PEP_ID=MMETSP1096-20121128/688_1 /TAXON_ID=156174 ORGANISM="Chrysochromulina ericina, Strain CCMP281" /NCGR_SAMPLE_ID=MMETSP1096 /ASSEMBLY_ACC=CAM_ASM_000453 /LENGTH=185 /DNA_ID=CAMNT_0023256643 /DNA_START=134 /DNA_END=691 /DNA_ORIENTATION=-